MHSFAPLSTVPLSTLPTTASVIADSVTLTTLGDIQVATTNNIAASNSIDCTAAITIASGVQIAFSISIDAVSSADVFAGNAYFATLSVDGSGSFTIVDGNSYTTTLSIDAVASIDEVQLLSIARSLSIDAVADFTIVSQYINGLVFTIAGIADIGFSAGLFAVRSLTIGSVAHFNIVDGQVYPLSFAIQGNSALSILPGWGYPQELSIDGVSDLTYIELYIKNFVLSIDGVADLGITFQYTSTPTLSISGISAVTIQGTGIWFDSLSLHTAGQVFVENIYDILYVSASIADFTVSLQLAQGGVGSNPSATAGFGVQAQCVFARSVTQTLGLAQVVRHTLSIVNLTQTFVIGQNASAQKAHVESVTDTLDFEQETEAVRPISSSLTFSQTAEVTKVKFVSVTQTLALTNSVVRNQVANLSVTQTLVLNPPNIKKLQGQFEFELPPAYFVLQPVKCLVILGVPALSIVLPCPQFDDSVSFQGTIDLKRSMSGVTYTYVKQTNTSKIKYDFLLWTNKYLELRHFLLNYSSEVMTLANWKGENWLVTLTNNPVQFTAVARAQSRGEQYTVTLEFEGIRIGGQSS